MPTATSYRSQLATTGLRDLTERLAAIEHERDVSEFEYEPVPIDRWITDKHYCNLGFIPSPKQMDALRHIEWVYSAKTWEELKFTRPGVTLKNFIVLMCGKGSGKDMISQVGLLRISYLLQCLRFPQGYYNIGQFSTIHLTNIAVSAPQATSVFYTPLIRLMESTPWWKDRFEANAGKAKFPKHIELISGHSDVSSQEGMNLLAGVLDEISEFKTKAELEMAKKIGAREPKMSAEAIDAMVRSSGRSRFPDLHKAIFLSWPRFKGDYICQLYDEGLGEQARDPINRWWVIKAATWDMNPNTKKADYADEYRKDPDKSKGKYECDPPGATDIFFKNKLVVGKAFPKREFNRVSVEYVEGPDPDVMNSYGWQAEFDFHESLVPVAGRAYAVHVDLALTGDKAGFAMSHVSRHVPVAKAEDEAPIYQEEVTLDLALAFPQGPHREIEIRWARSLIFRLVERGFHICRISFDGFQSADSIQILNAALGQWGPKVKAARKDIAVNYSVDRNTEGYDTLKSLIYAGLYKGYRVQGRDEKPDDCIWWRELFTVQRIGGGSMRAKIDHPPYGSKDVTDAIAGSAVGAIAASKEYGTGDWEEVWSGG